MGIFSLATFKVPRIIIFKILRTFIPLNVEVFQQITVLDIFKSILGKECPTGEDENNLLLLLTTGFARI